MVAVRVGARVRIRRLRMRTRECGPAGKWATRPWSWPWPRARTATRRGSTATRERLRVAPDAARIDAAGVERLAWRDDALHRALVWRPGAVPRCGEAWLHRLCHRAGVRGNATERWRVEHRALARVHRRRCHRGHHFLRVASDRRVINAARVETPGRGRPGAPDDHPLT